jgi:hypothetical protein
MPDHEAEIRAVKRKLFGDTAQISRSYIELLHKQGFAEQPFAIVSDWAKGEFHVYWLDGQLFRGLSWAGIEDSASASELAYPLSTLSSVNTVYNLQYDDFMRRHARWDRKATLHFREKESIVLEIRAEAGQDTDTSRFIDAVLGALA